MAMPLAKRLKENYDMDVTAELEVEPVNGKNVLSKGNIVSMLRSKSAGPFSASEVLGQAFTNSEDGAPNFKVFKKSHSKDSLSQTPVMHVTSYLDADPRRIAPVVSTRRTAKKQKVDGEEEINVPVSRKRTEDDIDMTAQGGATEESSSNRKDSSDATSPPTRKRSRSRSVSV
ncbi:hypothetical protein RvY_05801 [Ramazzottius varieornatus]|uniref:Uncharacterized protein n=1 Tax=Ramazzottius varieornatus TaxID=947166 RepID=A0A1D1V2X8_RAMVA|nr:hypothetical protein RvY_05801 [Ramazzottius varieornatus]